MKGIKAIKRKIEFHKGLIEHTTRWEKKRHEAFIECLTWVLQ